ncbi:MAG: hypothetical protein ACHQ50_15760 [Fimbriimonadales bacterium]
MDELQTLRHELADLRREVKTLRRARWITPASLVGVLIALGAFGVASPSRQDPAQAHPDHTPMQLAQEITCKSLKLVDATGKALIQLQSDKDGGLIVINGADGKARFFAGVENNAGFSDWCDAASNRRATVFIGETGGEVRLLDKLGQQSAVLHQAASGGSIELKGVDGKDRLAGGVDNGGGFMDIFDSLGSRRETFYLDDKDTAQFKLIGADKVARFLLTGNKDSGQAVSYDADGKAVAQFPPKAKQ